jgi:hypothetical protein
MPALPQNLPPAAAGTKPGALWLAGEPVSDAFRFYWPVGMPCAIREYVLLRPAD